MSASSTTQLFNDLASNYQTFRPRYPAASLASLKSFAAPLLTGTIVDIATGTGILLRQLRDVFGPEHRYVGVEPGRDMLATARRETPPDLAISFIEATAEDVPQPNGTAALVSVAQALHWFDRPRFYSEASRLLSRGGTFAVLYNQRDKAGRFAQAYENFTGQHNARQETEATTGAVRGGLGIVLLRDGTFRSEIAALPEFEGATQLDHSWHWAMSAAEFVGLSRSTVQMQNVIRALGEHEALAQLSTLIEDADGRDSFSIPYVTSMIVAKRR